MVTILVFSSDRKNINSGCLRRKCQGEYFDLRERKQQEEEDTIQRGAS
jgi:hypothetical protein